MEGLLIRIPGTVACRSRYQYDWQQVVYWMEGDWVSVLVEPITNTENVIGLCAPYETDVRPGRNALGDFV